jgi:hypothetical protein
VLLSWKNLGYNATLDNLVTWAQKETSTSPRRRKAQEFGVIL